MSPLLVPAVLAVVLPLGWALWGVLGRSNRSLAIARRNAPTRFIDPSGVREGPSRISASEPTVPTLMRVPRGNVGEGAAMPQFMPRPGASCARASAPTEGACASPYPSYCPTRMD